MTRLLACFAGVSALLFAALAVLAKLWLEPAGLPIFDARLTGYDLADANAYLQSLTPAGRQTYLGLFRVLDSLFPVALFLTLAGLLWQQTRGIWPLLRLVMYVMPLLYLAADLLENAQVAILLQAGAGLEAQQVRVASTYTQMKWLSGAMILALGLSGRGRQGRMT